MKLKRAFTLIELLVVIAIIGILAAIVVINVSSAQSKSRDARRKSDLDAVNKALNAYAVDHFNEYITNGSGYVNYSSWWQKGSPDGKDSPCWCGTNYGAMSLKNNLVGSGYLPSLPLDPQDRENSCLEDGTSTDPTSPSRVCGLLRWIDNRGYVYRARTDSQGKITKYILGTNLENLPAGTPLNTYTDGTPANTDGNFQIRVGSF